MHNLDAQDQQKNQDVSRSLCKILPDWGYSLQNESWLDSKFEDIRHGPNGPVEFQDIMWAMLPSTVVNAARETYEWLRMRRTRPMSLKSAARLAIRTIIIENQQRNNADGGSQKRCSLLELLNSIGLPNFLYDYVAFSQNQG